MDTFFLAVSSIGSTGFVILLCLLSYYCFDKELGRRLCFSVLLSFCLNGVLKDTLRYSRPIGAEGIRTVGDESLKIPYSPGGYEYSYSMPSGHAQTSSATWSVLGFYYKRFPVWVVGIIITLLVAVSRIYLGVHYPADVLCGVLLGFLTAALCALATHYLWDVKIFYAAACAMLIASFYYNPPGTDTLKGIAALCGLLLGSWLDDTFVDYKTSRVPFYNYLTLAVALALSGGLYFAMKRYLPDSPVNDFIRYFTLLFVASGPYPAIVMLIRRWG